MLMLYSKLCYLSLVTYHYLSILSCIKSCCLSVLVIAFKSFVLQSTLSGYCRTVSCCVLFVKKEEKKQ